MNVHFRVMLECQQTDTINNETINDLSILIRCCFSGFLFYTRFSDFHCFNCYPVYHKCLL